LPSNLRLIHFNSRHGENQQADSGKRVLNDRILSLNVRTKRTFLGPEQIRSGTAPSTTLNRFPKGPREVAKTKATSYQSDFPYPEKNSDPVKILGTDNTAILRLGVGLVNRASDDRPRASAAEAFDQRTSPSDFGENKMPRTSVMADNPPPLFIELQVEDFS
jgi:hypothetical protein